MLPIGETESTMDQASKNKASTKPTGN